MATRIASPRAASQAPKDSNIKMRNGLFRDVRQCIRAVRAVRVRRMLSVARRTMRRWVRWEINRQMHIIIGMGIRLRVGANIADGWIPVSGLQGQCYY